jgi:hypothetical protein
MSGPVVVTVPVGEAVAVGLAVGLGLLLGLGLAVGLGLLLGLGLAVGLGLLLGLGLGLVVQFLRQVVVEPPPRCPASAGAAVAMTPLIRAAVTTSLRSDIRTPSRCAHAVCTPLRQAME